jgi:hypothetical protein
MTEVGAVYRKYRGFLNGSFTSAGTFLIKGRCEEIFLSQPYVDFYSSNGS